MTATDLTLTDLGLTADVDWREFAACQGADPELFYVPTGADPAAAPVRAQLDAAKAVCAGCPVATECLRDAVESGDVYGVRGGLDEFERAALRRAPRAARPALST